MGKRVDLRKILANPVLRRKLMVDSIIATQAREGITTTRQQAEAAYDKIREEHLAMTNQRLALAYMLDGIKPGDKVMIRVPMGIGRNGTEWRLKTGTAVMRGTHGWVLNMGGRHGTPAVATLDNLISVEGRK